MLAQDCNDGCACSRCQGGPEDVIIPEVVFTPEDAAELMRITGEAQDDIDRRQVIVALVAEELGRQEQAAGIIEETDRAQELLASLIPEIADGDVDALRTFHTVYLAAAEALQDVADFMNADLEERPPFLEEFVFWERALREAEPPGVILTLGAGVVLGVVTAGAFVLWLMSRR